MQQPTDQPDAPATSRRPRKRRPPVSLPPMTLALAASMLLMALVQFTAAGYQWLGGDLGTPTINWALGAKVSSLIAHGEYWRLVTANFLHGSWLHLAGNVVSLFVVGRLIETFYGPARTFVLFVLTAIAGTIASYLLTAAVSLGASTGVLGLMGALVWHNWKYREHLPERLNYIYPRLLALVALQFTLDQILPGVDAFGHLGGFAAGVLLAGLMESRVSGEQQADREWLPLPTAVATAAGLLVYGAVGLLTALPRELPMLQAGRSGSRAERVQLVRSIVAQRPYFTEARYQLALELLEAGRFDDATREYQAAQAANPSLAAGRYGLSVRDAMIDYYQRLAAALIRAEQFEPALSCFQRMLQLNPEPEKAAEFRNACAWYLADRLNRDLDTAEQYVLRALEYDPDNWAYLDTLAWIYYKQNRTQKALTTQIQALQIAEERPRLLGDAPGLPELYYHLGAIQEKLGNVPEARSAYAKALSKQANYPEAQAGLDRLSGPSEEPGTRRPNPAGGTMI